MLIAATVGKTHAARLLLRIQKVPGRFVFSLFVHFFF
jgi:hypothetical protein